MWRFCYFAMRHHTTCKMALLNDSGVDLWKKRHIYGAICSLSHMCIICTITYVLSHTDTQKNMLKLHGVMYNIICKQTAMVPCMRMQWVERTVYASNFTVIMSVFDKNAFLCQWMFVVRFGEFILYMCSCFIWVYYRSIIIRLFALMHTNCRCNCAGQTSYIT